MIIPPNEDAVQKFIVIVLCVVTFAIMLLGAFEPNPELASTVPVALVYDVKLLAMGGVIVNDEALVALVAVTVMLPLIVTTFPTRK